jgi:hypothetical protein
LRVSQGSDEKKVFGTFDRDLNNDQQNRSRNYRRARCD